MKKLTLLALMAISNIIVLKAQDSITIVATPNKYGPSTPPFLPRFVWGDSRTMNWQQQGENYIPTTLQTIAVPKGQTKISFFYNFAMPNVQQVQPGKNYIVDRAKYGAGTLVTVS